MTDIQKLDSIINHIGNVQTNCLVIGRKLIAANKVELGRAVIANSYKHDNSKFSGIEWEYLDPDTTNKAGMRYAVRHHAKTNPHHPEYWETIHNMPEVYVYEMVADWKARSEEFGSSLKDYINGTAMKKYGYTKESPVYLKIMEVVDMLCAKPFELLEEPNEETIKKAIQTEQPQTA